MNFTNEIQLLSQVSALSKQYEKVAAATGENFNVFRILKLDTNETRTHSAFIAELLNPNGSHGFGDVFLRLFVREFKVLGFSGPGPFQAKVIVEEYLGPISPDFERGGQIDIVIKAKGQREIVIENKIYAQDQPKQLIRYKNHYPESHLFYLTLDGTEPTDKETRDRLKPIEDYTPVSYKGEVLNWLKSCRKEATEHSLLRETITQYINLIKNLTKQTMNDQMNEELVTEILRSSENINAAIQISDQLDNIKHRIMQGIYNDCQKIINEHEWEGLLITSDPDYPSGSLTGIKFYKSGWTHCIYFCFFKGFEDMRIAISKINHTDSLADLEFTKKVQAKLSDVKLGKELKEVDLKENNWIWGSWVGSWWVPLWGEVPSNGPKVIMGTLKEILMRLDNIQL